MFLKSFDKLTAEDVQELVETETYEHARLDYKGGHPAKWREKTERVEQEKEKLNFLKDVISMANRRGGDIIYGVFSDSNTGKPEIAKGFEETNWDSLERDLTDLIRQYIEPALTVQIRELERDEGQPLLVVRVPESWKKPHAVRMDEKWTYFMRVGKANRPCELEEIRQMYTGWQGIERKLEEFRNDRLAALAQDEGPVRMEVELGEDDPRRFVLVHVIPVERFARGEQIDVRHEVNEPPGWLQPLGTTGAGEPRYTSLGRVMFNGKTRKDSRVLGRASTYAMWMRNGGIEACYSIEGDEVHPNAVVRDLKYIMGNWKRGLEHHGIDGPFFFATCLLGWKGNVVKTGGVFEWPVNQNVIRVPHVIADNLDVDGGDVSGLEDGFAYIHESLGVAK